MQLRNLLKRFEPDRLKVGDKLESFSALGLHGEDIAEHVNTVGPATVLSLPLFVPLSKWFLGHKRTLEDTRTKAVTMD